MLMFLRDWEASGNPGYSLFENTEHFLVSFAMVVIKRMIHVTSVFNWVPSLNWMFR